ncbi:methyltransferase [Streptomyces thinghirensis]|nr:methyltransferase [Streptomyces thinghirensis]
MRPDGVLTTVDPEPGTSSSPARPSGPPASPATAPVSFRAAPWTSLPRLADAGYDLVFCDGDRLEYLDYLAESLRLLRPGGLVAFEGVFGAGRTIDSGPQPTEVLRLREVLRAVRENQSWCRRCCRWATGCCVPSNGERPARGPAGENP